MVQMSSSMPSSSNLSRAAFVAPVRLESALELAVLYTPGEVNRPKAVTPLLCFTHRGR